MKRIAKRIKWNWLTAMIVLVIGISSCNSDDCIYEYDAQYYKPITKSWETIRAEIGSESPRDINHPGKIFALGNLLFISEVNEGVHVIDNSDPTNPQNIQFINIPGSLDVAAIGNTLYTDNYTDIIQLDISDVYNVTEVNREENVFFSNSLGLWYNYTEDGVITDWEVIDTVYEFNCEDDVLFFDDFSGGVMEATSADGGVLLANDATGQAGSMARFAIYNTKLYALNEYNLNVFNIDNQISLENTVDLQWGVETLFPYQNYLFVGANNGMHIMDISDPRNPEYISTYAHITSCDPVVVKDDIAYVTLRSGNECQGFTNQLDVIDVSDKRQPSLLKTYEMTNPHGLGVTNSDLLFLCDGSDGLKVFDNEDYLDIQLLEHYEGIHAFDVIPYGGNLLMIGGRRVLSV